MTSSRAVSLTPQERRARRTAARARFSPMCATGSRIARASCRRNTSTTSAARSCSRRSRGSLSTISRGPSARFSSRGRARSRASRARVRSSSSGAGSAAKTRILLAAMRSQTLGVTYIPVDVSEEFLRQTRTGAPARAAVVASSSRSSRTSACRSIFRRRSASPCCSRSSAARSETSMTSERSACFAACDLICAAAIGCCLAPICAKDRATIEAAYNDSAGVTAEFNRNMLRVLNAELGADFVPERWAHRAFYNDDEHRIEMHLRCDGCTDRAHSRHARRRVRATANRFGRS